LLKFIQEIQSLGMRVLFIFQSKNASDYKKERLLKLYSLLLFKASIKIVFIIIIISLLGFLLIFLSAKFILSPDCNVYEFILSFKGFFVSILAYIIYFLFKKFYAKYRL